MCRKSESLPVKDASFFKNVAQVYVSVQKIWIQGYCLQKANERTDNKFLHLYVKNKRYFY